MARTVKEHTFDEEDALKAAGVDTSSGEIVPWENKYVPVDFEDAVRHFEAEHGALIDFEGSPYHVVDKRKLVGQPFIIVDIRDYPPEKWSYGVPWVTLLAVTKSPVVANDGVETNRVVINDGGSGIAAQITSYLAQNQRRTGIRVMGGLRISEYEYEDAEGKKTPAATFYIG